MNNKGIILSSLIYILFVFFLLLLVSITAVLWARQTAVDTVKKEANTIFNQ